MAFSTPNHHLSWEACAPSPHLTPATYSPVLPGAPLTLVLSSQSVRGFPGGSDGKESAYNAGDPAQGDPGSGRSPGEGNGNPPQYCCLENSMDRGAWCSLTTFRGFHTYVG